MAFEDRTYDFNVKKENYSEWYSQVLEASGILDSRYNIKAMFVWLPYGIEIMNTLKLYWDNLFKKAEIKEVLFPQFVPISYCEQNERWWEGFKEEGYRATAGDGEEKWVIRPTGEPAMYPMFSLWIRTKNDLPIRVYQTVSSFRYETKQTHPLIRDRQITFWFEIHTVHSTKEEADKELELHTKFYEDIYKNILALPPFRVVKPLWECFPGAVGAYEYYTLMPDGKVMENGSANHLGQAYAKKFNVKFTDEDGKEKYAWQVCTGNGARFLAAAISIHGDDKGLVLPPKIAPIQAVIIPILFKGKEEIILNHAKKLYEKLSESEVRVFLDEREISPGRKYNDWEVKGVPIRIELGPRDIENKKAVVVRRDNFEKISVDEKNLISEVNDILSKIHDNLYKNAKANLEKNISFVSKKEDIQKTVENGKIANIFWCNERECYDKIEEIGEGIEGFGIDLDETKEGKCIFCGKNTKNKLFVAKSY